MELQRLIAQVKRLPATPQLLPRLMQVLKDPSASSNEIVDMVKLDPSVAAQVQRLSNSIYYGFSEPSRDLHEAIGRIGMQETYKLVAAVLSQQMSSRRVSLRGLNSQRLWESSIAAALTMEALAHELGLEAVNAYSIGLFHNIGVILMAHAAASSYGACFVKAGRDGLSLIDAEQEAFGWNHADAARMLLSQWKFPESVVEPVGCQHCPHEAEQYPKEAAMMSLTHYLITHLELGVPYTYVYEDTFNWVMQTLELEQDQLQPLIEKASEQVEKVRDMLGARKQTA